MAATVESAFVLIDRASGTIRDIRRELRGLQDDAIKAGVAMDALSGPKVSRQMQMQARDLRNAGAEAKDYGRDIESAGASVDRTEQRVRKMADSTKKAHIEWSALGKAVGLMKWPALVAGAGSAVQVLGALTGGAVALLPKLLDLGGAAAAYGTTMIGAGAAMGVAKLATHGLSQALQGNKQALASLTPEGRNFVNLLKSMTPEVTSLQRAAQQGLFPGLGNLLGAAKSQMPALRGIVSQTATSLGGIGTFLGQQMQGPGFMKDLGSLAAQGAQSLTSAATGGYYFAHALEQVLLAARPLTTWMGQMFVHLGKLADQEAITGRENGKLADYFDRTKRSLQVMADIGKNVFQGLRNVMAAARGTSDSLWESIDKTTKRFDDWTKSASGQASMQRWFTQMRPVLHEVVGLLGDLAKGLGSLAQGSSGTGMLQALRSAVPALVSGLRSLTQNLGPAVIGAFASVLKLFGDLAGQAGPLTIVAKAIGLLATGADKLVRALGPLGKVLGTAVGAMLLLKRMGAFGDASKGQLSWLDAVRAKWLGIAEAVGKAGAGASLADKVVAGAKGAFSGGVGAAARGGLGGVVGWEGAALNVGSKANPIAVLAVDPLGSPLSSGGGLGGPGRAGEAATAEERAAAGKGFAQAESGLLVPTAARTAEEEAAAAGGGGLLATLKAKAGGLLGVGEGGASKLAGLASGAMGIAGAGGMGIMGGSMVQQFTGMRGGTAGTLGGGAIGTAAGAALGSVIPGLGTMLGAGLGGAIGSSLGPTIAHALGSLFTGESYGQKLADSLTKGFGGAASKNLRSDIAKALDDANKIVGAHQFGGVMGIPLRVTPMSAKDKAKAEADYKKAGTEIAQALQAGWGQYKFQDEPTMFGQLRAEIKKMPPEAQAAAIQSAIQFAQGLERQGKLPAGAARQMLQQAEREFPGFEKYVGLSAKASIDQFTKNLNFSKAQAGVKKALDSMRGDFPQVTKAMDSTADSITAKSGAVVRALEKIIRGRGSTQEMKDQATADLNYLRKVNATDFDAMTKEVQARQNDMTKAIASGSKNAADQAGTNLNTLVGEINKAMQSGVLLTNQGMTDIAKGLNAVLKSFGAAQLPMPSAIQWAQWATGQSPATNVGGRTVSGGTSNVGGGPGGRATGGRVPGPAKGDHIPLYATGGALLGIVDGGELVINQHTERDVDHDLMLAGKPTLDQRTRRETRKHSQKPPTVQPQQGIMPGMATGGRFAVGGALAGGLAGAATLPGQNTVGVASLPQMIAKANEITSHHYPYLWGGGHNANFTGPYDCSGAVSAVLHAGGVLAAPEVSGWFENFGLPGPGTVTLYANPTHVYMTIAGHAFGTSTQNPGGGADWFTGGARPGFVVRHVPVTGQAVGIMGGGAGGAVNVPTLKAPTVSGGGTEGRAMQAAFNKANAAANKYIQAHAPVASAGGGGGPNVPLSGDVENQVFQFMSAAGFNKIAIAGMLGNAWQESSMNPNAPGGGLWQQISNFGQGTGGSLLAQMQRMLPQIQGMKAALNAAGSPGAAAQIFEQQFERAGIPAMANRISAANRAYAAGYNLGGRLPDWGGWNATGADVTVRRPTLFGAGENGAERVRITPQGRHGSPITIAKGAVQINTAGGDKRALVRLVEDRLEQFAQEIADEIENGVEHPEHMAIR